MARVLRPLDRIVPYSRVAGWAFTSPGSRTPSELLSLVAPACPPEVELDFVVAAHAAVNRPAGGPLPVPPDGAAGYPDPKRAAGRAPVADPLAARCWLYCRDWIPAADARRYGVGRRAKGGFRWTVHTAGGTLTVSLAVCDASGVPLRVLPPAAPDDLRLHLTAREFVESLLSM